jgi:dsDNA-binding SOS-regulon protein
MEILLKQKTEELEKMNKSNKKLEKENLLFKQEFRMLMGTIKNMHGQITILKEKTRDDPGPLLGNMAEFGRLQRKYKFLEQENKRLKDIQGSIAQESRREFTKMTEMNKYYKILNQELAEYVNELKDGLGSQLVNFKNTKSSSTKIFMAKIKKSKTTIRTCSRLSTP